MSLSIRARLTLWSSAVLSLVLASAAAATYLAYARSRLAAIDEQLARAAVVARMAAEAQGITGRTPGIRLSAPPARDELTVLADAFNGPLGRLERALLQQRQFMADASHELRTPVSVARTAIEVSRARSGRAEAEYRDSLGGVGEQMRRCRGWSRTCSRWRARSRPAAARGRAALPRRAGRGLHPRVAAAGRTEGRGQSLRMPVV